LVVNLVLASIILGSLVTKVGRLLEGVFRLLGD
jgi:hypothetical protein